MNIIYPKWSLSSLAFVLSSFAAYAGPILSPVQISGSSYVELAGVLSDGSPVNNVTGIGDYGFNIAGYGTTASSAVSVSVQPAPTLSASMSFSGASNPYVNASAFLRYNFSISGPTTFVPVQIDAIGSVFGSYSGSISRAYASVRFVLSGEPGWDLIRESVINPGAEYLNTPDVIGNSGGFVESGVYSLRTNWLYSVDLSVGAHGVGGPPGGSASTSAFIDPTFQIALSAEEANQYSFEFSSGIGNQSPSTVPDGGSTLAMLGVVLAGFVGLRRKNSS